jgi:hypothetical protein
LSGRILKAAREQQAEVDADEAEEAFEQLASKEESAWLPGNLSYAHHALLAILLQSCW